MSYVIIISKTMFNSFAYTEVVQRNRMILNATRFVLYSQICTAFIPVVKYNGRITQGWLYNINLFTSFELPVCVRACVRACVCAHLSVPVV